VEASDDNLQAIEEVVQVFANLGIPYALGGSMASSLLGKPRFTEDADISVEPFPGQESTLVSNFGPDYYVSLQAVQQAVRQRSSFNIIHSRSGFKIDVFVCKDRPFEQSVMARRRLVQLADRPDQSIVVVSPEDIILLKLEWYRLGDEISDRQWSDILGVLKVQAGKLDEAYLDLWAADLGVTDLLARARQESSIGAGSA
jgi:hypothetical protein